MVAPLTASMSALCLARAPARSCGSAAVLMATDLGSLPGSCQRVDPGDPAAGDRDADLGAAVLGLDRVAGSGLAVARRAWTGGGGGGRRRGLVRLEAQDGGQAGGGGG
jgi:hypothetical protein